MVNALVALLSVLLLFVSPKFVLAAQSPDATVKIISRSVAEGVGLSWGDGVLVYKGQDYPFTFQANGLFRDVDPKMTAAELSGQVFNLKSPADLAGTYQKLQDKPSDPAAVSSATLKNQNGVLVSLSSNVANRKFTLGSEGLKIELKIK